MRSFFGFIFWLSITTRVHAAATPTHVAFCDGVLNVSTRAPLRPVLADLRQLREVLSTAYPPRQVLDPGYDEADVDFELSALLRQSWFGDMHARAVVRLRAIENTLTGPSAQCNALAVEFRGPEIAPALVALRTRVDLVDAAVNARGRIGSARLAMCETVTGLLCGTPVLAIGSLTHLTAAAIAAGFVFGPSYWAMRRLARGEILARTRVTGWPGHARAIEHQLRDGGPAFSMIGGSITAQLPVVRELAAARDRPPDDRLINDLRETMSHQVSFTPGEPSERVRLFFDAIFYTDPRTGEPVWMLISRVFEQWPREDVITKGPSHRRKGAEVWAPDPAAAALQPTGR